MGLCWIWPVLGSATSAMAVGWKVRVLHDPARRGQGCQQCVAGRDRGWAAVARIRRNPDSKSVSQDTVCTCIAVDVSELEVVWWGESAGVLLLLLLLLLLVGDEMRMRVWMHNDVSTEAQQCPHWKPKARGDRHQPERGVALVFDAILQDDPTSQMTKCEQQKYQPIQPHCTTRRHVRHIEPTPESCDRPDSLKRAFEFETSPP